MLHTHAAGTVFLIKAILFRKRLSRLQIQIRDHSAEPAAAAMSGQKHIIQTEGPQTGRISDMPV